MAAFVVRNKTLVLATLALAASGCDAGPGEWNEAADHRWRELAAPSGRADGFTRTDPGRTGVEFTNVLSEDEQARNRILGQGSGVAFGDVDGDGLVDVFFGGVEAPSRLFRNRGGWRFEDVTDDSGIDLTGLSATSVVFADVDGDGDRDLFVGVLEDTNRLFINDGTGHFSEQAAARGLVENRGAMTATMADVDGDGDLDLYVGNNQQRAADDLFHPADRGFDSILVRGADGSLSINPRHQDYYAVRVEPDGTMQRVEIAQVDDFYLNDGTGRFERVPFDGGRFFDDRGDPVRVEPKDWALAARFYDFDDDLDPDLYIANDFETNEHIWINRGDGTFEMVDRMAFRTTSAAAMAVDFSDVDRDGTTDLFVVDMLATERGRFQTMRQLMQGEPSVPGLVDFRTQRNRNTLFMRRPDGSYQEMANYAGVQASNWSWGTLFLDVDLDGYEDLLIGNGYQWDQQNMDLNRQLAMERDPEWERLILRYPALLEHNVAFRNKGDSTFEPVSELWGWGEEADISQGLATADIDGDGDLDVAVNRMNAPAEIYRNDAQAPRIAVTLVGRDGNTDAVGARIRVFGGPVSVQSKEVTTGGLYLSHAEQLYSFAAGEATELTIEVDWRSGRRTRLDGLAPGRLYEIREPDTAPMIPEPAEDPETLFEDVTEMLGGHYHADVMFDDFARQPLLPMKLSQLGPGLTWHDWDSDGRPDLIVPSGRGGATTVLLNRGDRFEMEGLLRARADHSAAIPVPGHGLLIGQSNYEAPTPQEAFAVPGLISLTGSGATALAPGDIHTSGPVATADVDGDGDLDVFLGGRTIPATYPRRPSSRLLLNGSDGLGVDEGASSPFEEVGMVSGAVFTDLDGDADPDLVLAVEWGPLKVFRNDGGSFVEATEDWGLAEWTNRWNGVTAVDADADGRMDLVATGWGRNTGYYDYAQVGPETPLRIYGWNFDGDEDFDALEAYFDPASGEYVPRARLERLSSAMRYVLRSVPTNEAYLSATIADIAGPQFERAVIGEARTLDHMLFLNRGDHFEAVALPVGAQLAPAFHVGAADVDGDGAEDLFLSQNFFPTEVDSFRQDGGRGLILLGDGRGGFTPLDGSDSGVRVWGEQRGAAFADFDADGRIDLAVSQNGAETTLFRNRLGEPGLTVRLQGTPQNPRAIGAVIRVVYPDGVGPAREIHGGSGYWSYDHTVPVLGLRAEPTAVRVRWPDGTETETPVPSGERVVTVER